VLRTALDALRLRLDGSRAAANTIIRKRAVLHGVLGYAAEAGLLTDNPLALARDFAVVAVDQGGIGLSDKPQDGYDAATLARLRRCDGRAGPPAVCPVRDRRRNADRLRPSRGSPGPGRPAKAMCTP
jgi:hypothetical protein